MDGWIFTKRKANKETGDLWGCRCLRLVSPKMDSVFLWVFPLRPNQQGVLSKRETPAYFVSRPPALLEHRVHPEAAVKGSRVGRYHPYLMGKGANAARSPHTCTHDTCVYIYTHSNSCFYLFLQYVDHKTCVYTLSIYLSIYLSACLSIYLSNLSIYLSIYLSNLI